MPEGCVDAPYICSKSKGTIYTVKQKDLMLDGELKSISERSVSRLIVSQMTQEFRTKIQTHFQNC